MWLASIIPRLIGVDSGQWVDSEADLVVLTDASLCLALSFVYGNNGFIYQLANALQISQCILIFTDSLNAVAVFNSLHANEAIHNGPLLGVTSVILCTGIDL